MSRDEALAGMRDRLCGMSAVQHDAEAMLKIWWNAVA